VYEGRRYPIELKVCGERDGLETVIERGRGQMARYMDTLGCQKGWLLVFDKQGGAVMGGEAVQACPPPSLTADFSSAITIEYQQIIY
jgi:hypothetical protein